MLWFRNKALGWCIRHRTASALSSLSIDIILEIIMSIIQSIVIIKFKLKNQLKNASRDLGSLRILHRKWRDRGVEDRVGWLRSQSQPNQFPSCNAPSNAHQYLRRDGNSWMLSPTLLVRACRHLYRQRPPRHYLMHAARLHSRPVQPLRHFSRVEPIAQPGN